MYTDLNAIIYMTHAAEENKGCCYRSALWLTD